MESQRLLSLEEDSSNSDEDSWSKWRDDEEEELALLPVSKQRSKAPSGYERPPACWDIVTGVSKGRRKAFERHSITLAAQQICVRFTQPFRRVVILTRFKP